jgi:hypothetical protein
MPPTSLRVAIFGGSVAAPGDPLWLAAEQLGAAVAARGWTLVNGGYGGSMLASAQAARNAGGHVIGVGCTMFKSPPNDFLSEVRWTDNLYDRLRALVELGDAFICLPGSTGTLLELALVWELINKRMLPPRPILCWGEFWRPVVSVFDHDPTADARLPDAIGLPARLGGLVTFVDSVPAAIAALDRMSAD